MMSLRRTVGCLWDYTSKLEGRQVKRNKASVR